jgi:DNA polymerase III delta subunit
MLYVFYGTDINKSSAKAHTLIDSLRAKKPDAAFESMSSDNWNAAALESHLGGQGLFSSKYIVFLNRLTENEEAAEKMADFAAVMNESANIFIVLEGKLKAELKKAFEKNAEKTVVSDLTAESARTAKKDFNIFALGDAVGSRDPIKSWAIYRQAIDNGIESEAILGTLFWQVKSMMLSAPAASASAAGLNPFVFGKSKRYASNYSSTELSELLGSLITLYHDGHRGVRDLEVGTERLLLGIKVT